MAVDIFTHLRPLKYLENQASKGSGESALRTPRFRVE
jgi:hypothetical protein